MTLLLEEQKKAFTDALEALNEEGLLRYVVIIGSWAEYLYECAFPRKGFTANLRTRDLDIFIPNRGRLRGKKNLVETMRKRGYGVVEDPVTGVSKFYREDLLEVQFVARSLGSGEKDVVEVPGLGIKTEALRYLNLLKENPISVYYRGLKVEVPAPEAYVLQKLVSIYTQIPAVIFHPLSRRCTRQFVTICVLRPDRPIVPTIGIHHTHERAPCHASLGSTP